MYAKDELIHEFVERDAPRINVVSEFSPVKVKTRKGL